MRRLTAYYVTLFGAVVLTNVAVYFVITRLLGLPATPSFRFLVICTLFMLLVATPTVYRRIRAERSTSVQAPARGSNTLQIHPRLMGGLLGFVVCSGLVVASVYLFTTGASIVAAALAIVAAVVAAVSSRRFRGTIEGSGSQQEEARGSSDS